MTDDPARAAADEKPPAGTRSAHADTLNALDEMQRSFAYALRRQWLAAAERIIVQQEASIASLTQQLAATADRRAAEAEKALTLGIAYAVERHDKGNANSCTCHEEQPSGVCKDLRQMRAALSSAERKEGHSALRLKDGALERFDPHPSPPPGKTPEPFKEISDDDEDADLMAVLFANRGEWQELLDFAEQRRTRPTGGGMVAHHWIEEAERMVKRGKTPGQVVLEIKRAVRKINELAEAELGEVFSNEADDDLYKIVEAAAQAVLCINGPPGKITPHWLKIAFERVCAGEPEVNALEDYGFVPHESYVQVRDDRDTTREKLAVLTREWAVMARACGNWREWPVKPSLDQSHLDWQVAARAILERVELREQLATLREKLEGAERELPTLRGARATTIESAAAKLCECFSLTNEPRLIRQILQDYFGTTGTAYEDVVTDLKQQLTAANARVDEAIASSARSLEIADRLAQQATIAQQQVEAMRKAITERPNADAGSVIEHIRSEAVNYGGFWAISVLPALEAALAAAPAEGGK